MMTKKRRRYRVTPEDKLEHEADVILAADRTNLGGRRVPYAERQEFYLEGQLELREDREIPSGLALPRYKL